MCGVCIGQRVQRFFFPVGQGFLSYFCCPCAIQWHHFEVFYTAATAALGGSRLCEVCEQGLRITCEQGVKTYARGQTSRFKKTPAGGKKKPFVLPQLQVWLKKRGSVRPHKIRQVMSQLGVLLLTPCLRSRAQSMTKSTCGQPRDRRNDGRGAGTRSQEAVPSVLAIPTDRTITELTRSAAAAGSTATGGADIPTTSCCHRTTRCPKHPKPPPPPAA